MPNHTVSTNVDTMLRAADNAAIRTAIGLGTTDGPTFAGATLGTAGLLMGGITHVNISGTGGINLTASGTNQNIVLTSSGTGYVSIPGANNGLLVTGNVTTGPNRGFRASTVGLMRGDSGSIEIASNARISWSNNSAESSSLPDIFLGRDDVGIMSQRNFGAAQVFRLYNQTDIAAGNPTNFDRASFGFTSNILRIGTENGGTYTTVRPIDFVVGGVRQGGFASNGTFDFALTVSVNGNFRCATITSFGTLQPLKLADGNANNFSRLQLGGTTSAFPAIKRNGTGIDIRLADDSAFAPLIAGSLGLGTANPVADLDIADTWNAPAITVTGASGNGTTATITFATQATAIQVGATIVVAGINPSGYNGTFVVTASTVTSVSYLNATTAAYGSSGTIERMFTSVKLNVTDTASNLASKLMDLQLGGVSQFSVSKNGGIRSIPSDQSGPALGGIVPTNIGQTNVSLYFGYTAGGNVHAHLDNKNFSLRPEGSFGFAVGQPGLSAISTSISLDAAGILAQRNLGTAQIFRVYNSTDATPATNYDRASFGFTSNVLRIGTENGGTYTTARPIDFITGGVVRMSITATGEITMPAGTSFSGPSSISVIGAGNLRFSGRSAIYSAVDGNITLFNNFSTGFNLLTFGGIIADFPALKRVGTGFQVVHAATTAALNVAAVDADLTFIEDRFRRKGAGSPESVVTAPIGAIYHRTDGGASTTLYVKESSPTPTTGWVAK